MSYLLLCFLPIIVSTSDRVRPRVNIRTLGLFHLLLNPGIIIRDSLGQYGCSIYTLLNFLRNVHHFGGLARGTQRSLIVGWEEKKSGSPAPTEEKD